MRLPIDSIMLWNGNQVTDHGRSELRVQYEHLGNEGRMVEGTFRRYHIARKRTWSCSWENLFSKDDVIADGHWAGEKMLDFFNNTPGRFDMTLTTGNGVTETIPVMFMNFEYSIKKRGTGPVGDLWDASCEIVEI